MPLAPPRAAAPLRSPEVPGESGALPLRPRSPGRSAPGRADWELMEPDLLEPEQPVMGVLATPETSREGAHSPRGGEDSSSIPSPATEEPQGAQVLVQPTKSGCTAPRGEQSVIILKNILSQKKALGSPTPKPGDEGKLTKHPVEGKPRPRPGDLIEIFRIGYEHWAIYVEDDCVVHLAPPSEEFVVGSITSVFSNQALVKYSRLEDVLHGCSWKVNNKLDGTYLPLPVDRIIQRTKKMVNKIVQYNLIEGNCEHFVNELRYGVPRSQQVEHILMEGARAAGAVISAVMNSMKPKPLTA